METFYGSRVQESRTDNGREFKLNKLKRESAKARIQHAKTAAYKPEQNSAAEQGNTADGEGSATVLPCGTLL